MLGVGQEEVWGRLHALDREILLQIPQCPCSSSSDSASPLLPPPTPPRLMIQQAEEAKVFFLAVFSLPMLLPTSSRNKEGPRRGGGGRRNERLVVLCKGRDEEINNSHYSQEGVKGKQSQSGQAVFSWLQQTLPGVIY